jgi:hypothetical protein
MSIFNQFPTTMLYILQCNFFVLGLLLRNPPFFFLFFFFGILISCNPFPVYLEKKMKWIISISWLGFKVGMVN